MAAYKSLQMTAPRYPVSGPGIGGRSVKAERGEFALTAALALNDTVELFYLHKGFRVTGGFIKSDDLDTGGSPAIVLAVGDAGDDDRYFTGATIGQAGGITTTMAATGLDFVTTKKTLVSLKVTTAPATGAATGTVVVTLFGYIEEPK
jgi:hypothetical protein